MLGLEPLTKKRIGFQSAMIYLPNTLVEASECFKHRVQSTNIPVQLPKHIFDSW